MRKKQKKPIQATKHQIEMISNAADILSAQRGVMDEDFNWDLGRTVNAIDRFLKKNGYKRKFK